MMWKEKREKEERQTDRWREKTDEDERRKGGKRKGTRRRSTALKSPICPWASGQPITAQQPILPPSLHPLPTAQPIRCCAASHSHSHTHTHTLLVCVLIIKSERVFV